MSKAEKKNDKPPGEDELTSTASFGGSAVRLGGHVGPYKLLSTLGEGGFAVVYLAEQEKPIRRRVALKVLKPGMDSKQIIARFEAERQALALLDHPNVAHVYDAGTTKHGIPYFAMEHVRGLPLTEHCDRYKLTVEERLKLFLRVCEAVQHAHHKGIVHRDIKPSNIQVCIEGEQFIPKVIDFGVAKALSQPLTERTLVTEQGQMIGTPEYMSPEQAKMTSQDIDTRTDIYSLGVLLYKLLVGTLPFKSETLREGSIDHLRQVICEESPKTPSIQVRSLNVEESTKVAQCCRTDVNALRRRLRGDLDWIILKAIEKDRTRRYQTAHALAEDIQRHIDHEPVLAGPPSKIYRLKKFLCKHRAQAIRAAMTAILLAAMVVIFVKYWHFASLVKKAEFRQHKDILSKAQVLRSNKQFQEALAEVETILNSKHVGPEAGLLRARLVLELQGPADAVRELEKLLNERDEIACPAHFLLARIYRESNPGDRETRKEYQQKATEHEEEGTKLFAKTAEAYFNRAMIAGTAEKTIEDLNEALELNRSHYDSIKARALAYYAIRDYRKMERDALAMTILRDEDPLGYSLVAIALREAKDFPGAIESHNKAIELSDGDPEQYSQRYETYLRMGKYQDALNDAQRCVEIEPEQFVYRFNIFTALVSLGDFEAARQQYRKIVSADSAQQQQFEDWVKKHVFKVLGAGEPFELPADIARDEAFSAMQEVADYYRILEAKAVRLVPGVYGQSSWSPDGKQLAYGRSSWPPKGNELAYGRYDLYAWQPKISTAGVPAPFGSSGIEILDIESRTTRLLVSFGRDPAWSPDNEYIVFARGPERISNYQEEVWIIPVVGGEPRRLALGTWPIWTSDSRQVFFYSRVDETLYSIRVDDPDAKRERIISCPSRFPCVSPDGKYVAYGVGNELRIIERSSGSVLTRWIAPGPTRGLIVRWSPDGKELSVAGFPGSDLGLWIFDVQRKKAWQIFDPPAISGIWSPDKSRMVIEIKNPFEENWLVTLDPNIPTYQAMAFALTNEDYLRRQRDEYIRLIGSDPMNTNIYLEKLASVGMDQYRMGAFQDTLVTFTRLDDLHQDINGESRPADVAFIAMALHQLGRNREAEAALNRLRCLFENGKYACEQTYLYKVEKRFAGENSKVYRVWECIEAGQLKEASQLVEELRSLPFDADTEDAGHMQSIIKSLAMAYHNRGKNAKHHGARYGETIADYEAVVRIDPNFARAFSDLAWLQAACPEPEFCNDTKAIENATKACELTNWKDCRYIGTLAAIYAQLGNFVTAVKLQQKAIDLLPESKRPMWQANYEMRLELYESGKRYDNGNLWSFSSGNMVAWWKLDENSGRIAADSSGNNCAGALIGGSQWQPSGGKVGGALEFDGDGDYVKIGSESIFDFTEEITVAAWVNITTIPSQWTAIVTKGNSAWRLSTYRDERRFHFAVAAGAGLISNYVHGDTEVATGQWHHVCGTYDGANIRLYVDGVEDPASPVPFRGRITSNDFDVCIGANSEKPGRHWNGLIDDVRIYNYALSQQEIRAVYGGEGSSPVKDSSQVGFDRNNTPSNKRLLVKIKKSTYK
ncbi:MAG: protein kinase domain-containing protein [Planctomycetota bacterium]|jgi:serine/threonine protein kinase/Flp pilus assembly protein TadD/Tol biopolymer transport system component